MANLEVTVGADLSNLSRGMTEAAKIVTDGSRNIDKSLLQIDNAAKRGGQSLQSFTKGTNQAGFALTNLGRVAQDAPFGFIGIQNNLNPLLESFQQLRQESGSNAAALKALGQSLIGPAGLGLALSLVSSAFVIYQQIQQRSAKTTKEADDANKLYRESLTGVNAALLKGSQDAQKEIVKLNNLVSATRNVNLSIQERTKAAKLLQATYPETFKNFTTEEILLGKAKGAYDELTKSLIAQATVKAFSDKVADNSIKKLEIEGRLAQKQAELKDAQAASQEKLNKLAEQAKLATRNAGSESQERIANTAVQKFNTEREKSLAKISSISAEISKIEAEKFIVEKDSFLLQRAITDEVSKQGVSVLGLDDNLKKSSKSAKNLKSELEKIKPISEDFLLDTFRLANTKPFEFNVKIKPVLEIQGVFSDAQLEVFKQLNDFNNKASEIINGGIADTFSGLASAIGNGLVNGGNTAKQLGSVLLGSIGTIAIQLGQLAIGVGVGIKAIKVALKSLNPAIALAGGIALVALGSAIKSAASNISNQSQGQNQQGYQIPQFANGVTNFSGGTALVGERGPELVTLPTKSNVITNENIRRYMGGNNSSSVVIPDVKIKGQDLVVVFNRADKNFNRVT